MRLSNSPCGIISASQSEGPMSKVGCTVNIARPLICDRGERSLLERQRLGALRGQQDRLATEEITCLRQILVRVNHEQHVRLEHGRVVERNVTRADRAEAEAMPASPD